MLYKYISSIVHKGYFHGHDKSMGGAESIILSSGGTESMILSARAESIILLAPPWMLIVQLKRLEGLRRGLH
jgi:hypothetical protein